MLDLRAEKHFYGDWSSAATRFFAIRNILTDIPGASGKPMPKPFVRKCYDRWIADNLSRFRYPPRIVKRRKSGIELQFYGLTERLTLWLDNRGGATFWVAAKNGEILDIIQEFDIYLEKSKLGGHYCRGCWPNGEPSEIFPTRDLLWASHILEPMLLWVNDINACSHICIYQSDSFCWTKLTEDIEAERLREGMMPVEYLPVKRLR